MDGGGAEDDGDGDGDGDSEGDGDGDDDSSNDSKSDAGGSDGDKPGLFVSSVTWSPSGRMLVAANSCGAVKIMELTAPP